MGSISVDDDHRSSAILSAVDDSDGKVVGRRTPIVVVGLTTPPSVEKLIITALGNGQ